ncbi:M56 family metallopeptidase [uncultured Flavonifractor sp.]|uniref:M56 family metallopeptidase n=1 Tax=uncultured Flavonifractor sp. TaxID=1193534 RepID=UPI0026708CBD|nr:M56 family metallopeptidase [uncultured Flavonifractor sp.]
MLAGVFRPVLLLPEDAGGQGLRYALLHELVHYRRRDIWLKTLVLWVNAVHWFNPLVWRMVRSVERDTELACDEGALKRLPQEEHAAYGRAILQAVAALRKEKA